MKTIFILIAILAFVFFSRNYWQGMILSVITKYKNRTKNDINGVKEQGAIFAPTGTTRTFNLSIEIQEMGDGTAKISLTKLKNDI